MTLIEHSDYTQLKNKVLRRANTSEQYNIILSQIKELFRDDINSPRRYEKITTIGELLKILEIRDVLSVNNVAPLKEIARKLSNSDDLLRAINEYESTSIVPTHFVSYYASEKTPSIPNRESVEANSINNKPNTNMSTKKKQRIVETIIEDIGITWKDLARGLDIKEKVIDDLNDKYRDVNQKAMCIMELYNKKADDNMWFFDLCDALETCKRRELVRKIKKIVVMNI